MNGSLLAAAWRENRIWPISLALLLVVNVGLYLWIAFGVSPGVEDLERRYIAAQNEVRHGRQGGRPATMRELFDRAGEDLAVFRLAIPARSEFTGLIEEVFNLAAASGLSIDRIGYTPEFQKEADLLRYGLAFSVAGDYGQVKNFIAALEQSSRIIAIEEISLAGDDKAEKEGGAVSLRIRLATYFKAAGS